MTIEEATQSAGERVGVDQSDLERNQQTIWKMKGMFSPRKIRQLDGSAFRISSRLSTGTSGKGAREDVGQGAELQLRHPRQRHVVEDRAVREVQLLEEEAPVQVRLCSLLVDLSLNIGLLKADGAVGLLANEGDVVLWRVKSVSVFLIYRTGRRRKGNTHTSSTSSGVPGFGHKV